MSVPTLVVIMYSWAYSPSVVDIDPVIVLNSIDISAPPQRGELEDFMNRMAFYESSGVHDTVSAIGMLGKYQFSPNTLEHLRYTGTIEYFLNNESVQDNMFVRLLRNNRSVLRSTIDEYDGVWVEDTYVTKSGILAGAHLVGPGGVLAFLYPDRFNFSVKDGNGIHVRTYIKRFSNYNLYGAI